MEVAMARAGGIGVLGSVVVGAMTPNRRYHALLVLGWLAFILVDLSAGFADVFGA